MRTAIDREALLVALVLAPATYSRNRFFQLYVDPEARHVRRRASLVRSILRHAGGPGAGLEALAITPNPSGSIELSYVVSSLGLKRTTTLAALELSLVRFALARRSGAPLADADPDRATIEAALRRLAGTAGEGFEGDFVRRAPDTARGLSAPPSAERS